MAEANKLMVDFFRDNEFGLIDYNLENRTLGKSGTLKNWIFPDMPRDKLSTNSYPRVSVISISESGELQGIIDSALYWQTIRLQIDIWTKKDLQCTLTKGRTTSTINTKSAYENIGTVQFRI